MDQRYGADQEILVTPPGWGFESYKAYKEDPNNKHPLYSEGLFFVNIFNFGL